VISPGHRAFNTWSFTANSATAPVKTGWVSNRQRIIPRL
jgi:hypothetical protein